MSDSESAPPAPRPTVGGKTLESIERPRYKSWRKKYRKIRHRFDGVLEENKRLFREEQKLELTAKRLREELDGLLDLCLELNQNPALPPELRFDVSHPARPANPSSLPPDLTPDLADELLVQSDAAVRSGQASQTDVAILRRAIDDQLAAQGVENLESLERSVTHAVAGEIPEDLRLDEPPGYLTLEQEVDYVTRLDAKLDKPYSLVHTSVEPEAEHWAKLTPREYERQMELLNPQSQHNWLKMHAKPNALQIGQDDDNESLASHDNNNNNGGGSKAASGRKKQDKNKTLAKQVGNRAVERAREGWSPGAASGMEEDELAMDDAVGSGRKKARDPDGTYRLKGGKSGGVGRGKRKRSGEDLGPDSAGPKKARMEDE